MKSSEITNMVGGGFSRSIVTWGISFLVFIILTGLAFWYGSHLDRIGREATNHGSDLRLLSQQMTTQALSASQGFEQSFLLLKQHKTKFDDHLTLLTDGDAEAGFPAFPAELKPELDKVTTRWAAFEGDIESVLDSRVAVVAASKAAKTAQLQLPQLLSDAQQIADAIRKNRPSGGEQIYQSTMQVAIAQRISNSFASLQSGQKVALEVADQLQADTQAFSRVIDGMLHGGVPGVSLVSSSTIRDILTRLVSNFGEVADNASAMVDVAPVLYEVKNIAASLEGKGRELYESVSRVELALKERNQNNQLWTSLGFLFGVLTLLSFLLLLAGVYKNTRQQLADTKQTNDENQQAILTLLDEMSTLADGDLTVKATVTENITGAIADSVNYAVEALRTLVVTINQAASNVAKTSRKTRDTALQLSESSEQQARKIVSASDSVGDLTHSISKVSRSAEVSTRVAEQSVSIARKGVATVQKTIQGMDSIRNNIQDTSKRIKRLGESSQEIGDIVGLITDIADQTNILALNAAIQASSAGEGGRGFAVVADEVQRLAERASHASKQIETLVKTIQTDTNEAIQSMEKSTTEVVSGTRQSEEAGQALEEIEKVSTQLADLIKGISEEASEQAIVSSVVGEAMTSIQQITRYTVESTRSTAGAIGQLAEQAGELRRAAEGFRLPGQSEPIVEAVKIEPVLMDDEFEDFLVS